MSHKRLFVSAAIIAFFVFGMFLITVPRARDVARAPGETSTNTIPVVRLRDTYKKGVHTLVGEVIAHDACSAVRVDARGEGKASSTDRIVVEIILASEGGVCLEIPKPLDFKTTVIAPADLPITVTVNGAQATTTAL